VIQSISDWTEPLLESELSAFCEEKLEGKLGQLAQPLRIALTGTPVSPPIFASLALLEKSEVTRRIQACLDHFGE